MENNLIKNWDNFYINNFLWTNNLYVLFYGENMSEVYKTFTSESVTSGHPDKVADIIFNLS